MDYVAKKVAHLKRTGLVAGNSTGLGFNGGACPDWLRTEQESQRKAQASARRKNDDAAISLFLASVAATRAHVAEIALFWASQKDAA